MAVRRKVANPLALAVLAYLAEQPRHPYEMGRLLREHGRGRSLKVNNGSLYMVVNQLRRAGFIDKHATVRDTQRPERTVYTLTDSGRSELHDWLRESLREPSTEYPHFGVALSFLVMLPPTEAGELLADRLRVLAELLAEQRAGLHERDERDAAWWCRADDRYRLALLEAEQQFVAKLADSIGQVWREPSAVR